MYDGATRHQWFESQALLMWFRDHDAETLDDINGLCQAFTLAIWGGEAAIQVESFPVHNIKADKTLYLHSRKLFALCMHIVQMRASWLQIRDLNSGTFGFVELALDKTTGQQVAIKFIERGDKVLVPPTCRSPSGRLQGPPPPGLVPCVPVEGHRCPDPLQEQISVPQTIEFTHQNECSCTLCCMHVSGKLWKR